MMDYYQTILTQMLIFKDNQNIYFGNYLGIDYFDPSKN
jgi:hypothetical protein